METTTLVKSQKELIRFRQARVCDLLQWKQGTFAIFLYRIGNEFLDAYFDHDQYAIDTISRRVEFWNWFKNEWHLRDEVYLYDVDGMEDQLSIAFRNKLYSEHHNPLLLAAEIAPPTSVYPENFPIIKIAM